MADTMVHYEEISLPLYQVSASRVYSNEWFADHRGEADRWTELERDLTVERLRAYVAPRARRRRLR